MVVEKPDYRHRHLLPTRGDRPRHRRTTQKRESSSQAGAGMQDIGLARIGQGIAMFCNQSAVLKSASGLPTVDPLNEAPHSILPKIASEAYSTKQISECVFTQRGSDSAVRASLPRVRTPQNRDISKPGLFQSSAGKLSPILPFPWYARGISLEQHGPN